MYRRFFVERTCYFFFLIPSIIRQTPTTAAITPAEYALQTKKHVLPLLKKNLDMLPRDKTETDTLAWQNLQIFRRRVEKAHHCAYWTCPDDLQARLIIGLSACMKTYPESGWTRANLVPSESTLADLIKCQARIKELEKDLAEANINPPTGAHELLQGG